MIRTERRNRSLGEFSSVPEELSYRFGEAFRRARTQFGLTRENVEKHLDDDSGKLAEFERGNRDLSNDLWAAYAAALRNDVSVPYFKIKDASSLMRGLVNQIRLCVLSRPGGYLRFPVPPGIRGWKQALSRVVP